MATIQEMVKELDLAMNEVYADYINLHKELDEHKGHPITDTNLPEVNRILKEIQLKFADLFPAYHFIASRNQYCINAVNQYNDFVENLKKASSIKYEEDAPKEEAQS